MTNLPPIALIAGEGKMPEIIIDEIHAEGRQVFLLAIYGSTPDALTKRVDDVLYLHITQLGKAIKECSKREVKELIMAGRVQHKSVYGLSLLKMDWTTLKLWWSMPDKRADTLLGSIANAFAAKGIQLLNSVNYLRPRLAPEGLLTKTSPSQKTLDDIHFGITIAKEMGRLDIGQTVVVKDKAIVAIEAMEGTDDCIERAGKLAGNHCVIIKMPKPNQDMRFDVPTIGVNTIQKLAKIKASAIAIEARRTLIIDEETIAEANKLGIVIISLPVDSTESTIST